MLSSKPKPFRNNNVIDRNMSIEMRNNNSVSNFTERVENTNRNVTRREFRIHTRFMNTDDESISIWRESSVTSG